MRTALAPVATPETAPDDAAPSSGGGRRERARRWRAGWTVALRMARRDVRRHRGRSALVVAMVVLPTLLLSAVVTLAYTSDVTGVEQIPATMGSGQALLEGPDTTLVRQGPDPAQGTASLADPAQAVPGLELGRSAAANTAAVSRLVGAPVAAVDRFAARVTVDGRRLLLDGLALDGRLGLGEKLRLTSGRWPVPPPSDPEAPVEVLLTPLAAHRGVAMSGDLTLTVDGRPRAARVVGTVLAADSWSAPAVVTAGSLSDSGGGGWIVLGDDPVTWPEVLSLNDHGFRVTSAAVLRDPPPDSALPPEVRGMTTADGSRTRVLVGLGATMLLVTTTLLVGPAFAVSAARQRRTLALVASNGATTSVLRRTVLAQALVLGAASALVGVVAGVGVAWGVVQWTRADGAGIVGPFEVRTDVLGAVALCAVLSTAVAALVPARRLGRLDIVGVMRGQSVSPPPSGWVLLAGLVLAGAGAVATLVGTGVIDPAPSLKHLAGDNGETVVVGAATLIIGSLLVVPTVLAGVGAAGTRLPTALRMAARDLARHRARSAPAVAAVLAAVAGLTFGLTGLESDTEQRRLEYLPSTLPGEVLVAAWSGDLTTDQVRSAAAGLLVSENRVFAGDPGRFEPEAPTTPYRASFVSVVPDGCTVEQTLSGYAFSAQPMAERCVVAGSESMGSGDVLLLPAEELVRRLGVTGRDAAAVRAGAAVVTLPQDTVRVVTGSYPVDPTAQEPVPPQLDVTTDGVVAAVRLPLSKETSGRMLGAPLALAADTPVTRGWPTRVTGWTVRTAEGAPVPDALVERMQQALGDEVSVQREDGFQRDDRLVVGILLGVFGLLILVVTLTSTALTLAEQQTDHATLAALGATRWTRRVMAAAQAFLLAGVGCALGVAVGVVPGIAIARPLTSQGWDPLTNRSLDGPGVLVIPWEVIAVLGVAVPVLAGLLAAAGIRRAPRITRRAT